MHQSIFRKARAAFFSIEARLALKSAIFALAWLYLPLWIFLPIALYFYFIPLFQPGKTALPFAILLYFTIAETANPWLAVLFGSLFFIVLGVKDLVFINRAASREVLSLLLIFLLAIKFFLSFNRWDDVGAAFFASLIAVLFFFLAKAFVPAAAPMTANLIVRDGEKKRDVALAVLSFFFWQMLLTVLFLPLNFLYQSAIFIVTAAMALELFYDYFSASTGRRKILLHFSIFFVFIAVILASAQWGL